MSTFSPFARRVLLGVGIFALVGVSILLAEQAITVLLLVFAGLVVAVYLRGLADLLEDHTPLGPRISLVLVLLLHLLLTVLLVVYAVPVLEDRASKVAEKMPEAIDRLETELELSGWGRALLSNMPEPGEMMRPSGDWLSRITGMFSAGLTFLVNMLVIGFIGVYVASEPKTYRSGLLRLIPPGRRERAGEVLTEMGSQLRWWLLGRFASAAIIAVLSGVGLWVIGIPLPWLMGLLAGVLTFIPNIGPTVAVIPPALLALLQSPRQALIVVAFYVAVQFLESYVVTPLIQRRAVQLPPALLLTSQVLLGVLTGILGVALAAPLLVALVVAVRLLYVEDVVEAGQPSDEGDDAGPEPQRTSA